MRKMVVPTDAGTFFSLPAGAILPLPVEGAERALQQAGASLPGSGVPLPPNSCLGASDLQAICGTHPLISFTGTPVGDFPGVSLGSSLTPAKFPALQPQHAVPQPLHHPVGLSQSPPARAHPPPGGGRGCFIRCFASALEGATAPPACHPFTDFSLSFSN